jgi:DNA-repair protein XRCC1
MSTDEEDVSKNGTDDGLPVLPDFFSGKTFLLYGKLSDRRTLVRYIVAYNGRLADYMGDTVSYVVTDDQWDDTFDQALSENMSLVFVRPAWLHACHNSQKCVPYQKYAVVAP